jgi:hypothetical protein
VLTRSAYGSSKRYQRDLVSDHRRVLRIVTWSRCQFGTFARGEDL